MIKLKDLLTAIKPKGVECCIEQKDGAMVATLFRDKSIFKVNVDAPSPDVFSKAFQLKVEAKVAAQDKVRLIVNSNRLHIMVDRKKGLSEAISLNEWVKDTEMDLPDQQNESFSISAKSFYEKCDWVAHSVSTDKTKPMLGCIRLDMRESGLCAAAADGHRLSYAGAIYSPTLASMNLSLADYRAIKALKLKGDLFISSQTIVGDGFYYFGGLPGHYPQYEMLIPDRYTRTFALAETDLICSHLKTFRKKVVKLEWDGDFLLIEGEKFQGARWGDFRNFSVKFQAPLLRSALLHTQEIAFSGGSFDQVLFDPYESKSHMLMPVRL